ncbi:Na+/H+ antiporter NhaA [Dyadobacter sediminis]|uniref:Na+/H+ antiporter NhaA n=1 Tax=Dyadobacter sediminis TaxID=1493691 RepID=UPI0019B31090|nr:Na+/H+ antiporter NhaA [Dyadobacter sediminis]GGB83493.1 hypothetical protein GCM10011325_08810 [Dyadobacter sediminis]
MIESELSSFKKASLPVLAALDGAFPPALIYLAFNMGTETADGWAIPMTTDIAFALVIIPTTKDATESFLEKLEPYHLNPFSFAIMPIFALANTNITFEPQMLSGLTSALGSGIIAGRVTGKTVGVSLFSCIAVKLSVATMPKHATWRHILGVGMLGGIGFTMLIFIALLSSAGQGPILSEAKFSILTASVISGLVGYFWLRKVKSQLDKPESERSTL